MSEIKLISPLLDNYDFGGSISEHNGVSCYPAMKKDSDDRYIIKKVSIPASQTQLDALLLTGAYPDPASALSYFKEQADATVEELETLRNLAQLDGFFSYEDWQVCAKDDSVGFDVYMLGTYKYSLRKYLQHQPMTHLSAVNLGLDICAALSVCRSAGYLYVDLKPNNIYVDDRNYRIGDLGFLRMDSLRYATLPDKYYSQYTAPEALDAFNTLSPTMDIYAIGLILYQAYNGGELPFKSQFAPAEKFPSPQYADYEMAEIILKACDPDPAARWQDPVELGQALVTYMQRNGANDTPIVPPVVQIPDEEPEYITDEDSSDADDLPASDDVVSDADETLTDVDLSGIDLDNIPEINDFDLDTEDNQVSDEADELVDLSFLDEPTSDETAPENNLSDVDYNEVSDELNEILSQADELVAFPVPDPVVAPEGASVSDIEAEVDAAFVDVLNVETSAESEEGSSIEETVVNRAILVSPNQNDPVSEGLYDEDFDDYSYDTEDVTDTAQTDNRTKRKVLNWVLSIIIFLLVASIIAVGIFYYKNVYLLPIDDISVDGNDNSMVVHVDSDIDESLLNVICSDSHGNQISAPVVNGTATFANLTPDTAYTVRIMVDGFHRLTGETAASYSTPAQTNIVQFSAITGAEDGSVILSFTVEGPDTGDWKIQYHADGEETVSVDALSHRVNLSGLTVGKEYTFTLVPGEDMYVTGLTEITFTASNLVYAENVNITSCLNNQLTVTWDAPADVDVSSWTVRCYNDVDYNQTAIISDTTAVFDGVDPSYSYTVEVAAAGMSESRRAFMAENAITISNFTADTSSTEALYLAWEASQDVPEGGWVLLYSIDGSDALRSVSTTGNFALISPVVPGASYTFKLQQANGVPVLSTPLSCEIPGAQDFSGYGMTRSTMSFQLCKRPGVENWTNTDLADSDYTSSFALGESISLLGQLHGKYGVSDDVITVLFVIKDSTGKVVSHSYFSKAWSEMWKDSYSGINVQEIPSEAGAYTLTMYFNGKFVTQKDFTVTA